MLGWHSIPYGRIISSQIVTTKIEALVNIYRASEFDSPRITTNQYRHYFACSDSSSFRHHPPPSAASSRLSHFLLTALRPQNNHRGTPVIQLSSVVEVLCGRRSLASAKATSVTTSNVHIAPLRLSLNYTSPTRTGTGTTNRPDGYKRLNSAYTTSAVLEHYFFG